MIAMNLDGAPLSPTGMACILSPIATAGPGKLMRGLNPHKKCVKREEGDQGGDCAAQGRGMFQNVWWAVEKGGDLNRSAEGGVEIG